MIEENIDKKLANRISYQIRYKQCSKESLVGESKSAKGGPRKPGGTGWVDISIWVSLGKTHISCIFCTMKYKLL